MPVIHAKQALTPEGWAFECEICVDDGGMIVAVGEQRARPDHRVDLALPAPANVHSHTFQRAMSGLTESRGPSGRDSFWSWRRLMYRFLDQLTPDDVQAIAALAFMEMMEAGYASVGEFHYLHHGPGGAPYANDAELSERIVASARSVGIGLTLLPVLYQFGGCDRRPLEGGQRRFGCTVGQFEALWASARDATARAAPDYTIGVAPHSLRAVDAEGLTSCVRLAGAGPIHMHVAEQVAEVDEVRAHLGARPVTWLLDHYPADPQWCLIHCTQMTADETRRLARSGAVAGLCPITEASLGDGIFDGVAYTEAGGAFGIGTDSNIHVSFFQELCTLEYTQRLRDRQRVALATLEQSVGRFLVERTARDGASAIGRHAGALEVGRLADIVGLSTDNAWLCDRRGDTVLDSLVFSGHGQTCVRDVWSAGRHCVQAGQHVARARLIVDYRRVMDRLDLDRLA